MSARRAGNFTRTRRGVLQEAVVDRAQTPVEARREAEGLPYAGLQVERSAAPAHATAIVYGGQHGLPVVGDLDGAAEIRAEVRP